MSGDRGSKNNSKVTAALARSEALSPERRSDIARKAALARWDGDLPATSHEGTFPLGDVMIGCAVLPNGQRIITQSTFLKALGRARTPKAGTGVLSSADGTPFFLSAQVLAPFVDEDLLMSTTPVFYRTKSGARKVGYDARLLPRVAEVYLRFRDAQAGEVPARYAHLVLAADVMIRGLANVGIIALVDEATGFQRDRAQDALARILEEFIAKELRPWVHTFPEDFYAQLFRLRGMNYPRDTVKKPRYFGHLTNDIVYKRLAPGILDELKKVTPKTSEGRPKHQLHRRLTDTVGHPKLREHLASVVTVMKLSENYGDFIAKMDRVHPRFGETLSLVLDDDSGLGL